jgi:hypothetical protein
MASGNFTVLNNYMHKMVWNALKKLKMLVTFLYFAANKARV